ncbi:MAG: MBL fold metallo-hydrolase, partial [Muribaculaceae bacterium]|nr:MBL fold metallo-hydrolase [Muribaculaceae bacterium]
MSYFNVTILGCGSATPTLRHNPSAQFVTYRNKGMLVDCGEGTQLQLRRFGLSFARISDIFISHLHGDHFLGLPGLLSTSLLYTSP